MSGKKWI